MEELAGLFKQPPLPADSIRSLNPDIGFVPKRILESDVLPELYLGIHMDDCETSALYAKIAKLTSLYLFETMNASRAPRHETLKKLCDGWNVFKGFTTASWDLMTKIFDRGNAMLKSNQLRTMTAIGLATNASAEQISENTAHYCGHCFNVSFVKTPSMKVGKPGLCEGTSAMYQLRVDSASPRVTVKLQGAGGQSTMKTVTMPDFLSLLSSTVLMLTQVINKPNGGMRGNRGWPLDVQITGWLGKTMVMNSLDSDASQHLDFYNRIMYVGWPCTDSGLGCMPVEERVNGIVAGCHPYLLSNQEVRGVDAALPEDIRKLMSDIMEEVTPPMVNDDIMRTLASHWIPCRPLESINTEMRREPGVTYNRVVSMECPCAPEYLAIIHEAKRRFAEEANRINDAKSDSDGIRVYALLEGLSSHLCTDVPNRTINKVTFVESAVQALLNVKYFGFKPPKS